MSVKMPEPEVSLYVQCANGMQMPVKAYGKDQVEAYAQARVDEAVKRARPTYYSDGYQDGWNSALEQAAKRAESMNHDSAPYWVALRIRELKKEQS